MTANREILIADQNGGLLDARDDPAPEQDFARFVGSGGPTYTGPGADSLATARSGSVLAFSRQMYIEYGTGSDTSTVYTTDARGAAGRDFQSVAPADSTNGTWDTDPALSPDGSKVVYTHAASKGGPTSLRIAPTKTGSVGTDVPGSAGLTDAVFAADGTTLIAVQTVADTSQLVRLDSKSGVLTVIAHSSGLTAPDVASDATIVAVRHPDPNTPLASELVLLHPSDSAPAVLLAASSGSNTQPRFSPDGATVYYVHDDTATDSSWGDGYALDLYTGTAIAETSGGGAQAPAVLAADGHHQLDTASPRTQVTAPSALATLTHTVGVSWNAADAVVADHVTSGLRNIDVRYRTATASAGFGAWVLPSSWQGTSSIFAGSLRAVAGTEYCVSARARDLEDNVSAWSAPRCTAVPLDDRALKTSARRYTGKADYLGTYTEATRAKVSFSRAGVTANRIGLVVQSCPQCGAVDVALAGHHLGRVTTHGTVKHQQVAWLPAGALRSGTLVLTTVSAAPVRIDGVLTLR